AMVEPQTDIAVNEVVQIDETYVKGEAKNRNKYTRKLIAQGLKEDKASIVLGMVDKDNVVMKVVPNCERDTLKPVIRKHIPDLETLLVTDSATYYHGLELAYKGRI